MPKLKFKSSKSLTKSVRNSLKKSLRKSPRRKSSIRKNSRRKRRSLTSLKKRSRSFKLNFKGGLKGGYTGSDSEDYKDTGINPEKSGVVQYLLKAPFKIASSIDRSAKSTASFVRKAFSY